MLFSRFLIVASREFGESIPEWCARWALTQGHVDEPHRSPNGYRLFSEEHVRQLLEYMRSRSLRGLRHAGMEKASKIKTAATVAK